MISTVKDLIAALGGSKTACEAFNVRKSAISFWRVKNTLPLWAMPRAKELAEAVGYAIDPKLLAPKERIQYGTGPYAAASRRRTASKSKPLKKTKARRVFASAAE